jgi:t-SNARE complex subunit (syntaxin)
MKSLLICSCALTAALAGCKPFGFDKPDIQIRGQLFIVTRGASNLPLGDVPVIFYNDAQIASWKTDCGEVLKRRQLEADQTQQAISEVDRDIDAARRALEMLQLERANVSAERRKDELTLLGIKCELINRYANTFATAQQEILRKIPQYSEINAENKLFLKSVYPVSDDEAKYITSISGVEHCFSYYGAVRSVHEKTTFPLAVNVEEGVSDDESFRRSASFVNATSFISKTVPLMDKWSKDVLAESFPADIVEIKRMFKEYAEKAATLKAETGKMLEEINERLKTVDGKFARIAESQRLEENRMSNDIAHGQTSKASLNEKLLAERMSMTRVFDVDKLPEPTLRTRTDANGTFSAKLNSEKIWTLYSRASRIVDHAEESYTWLLNIDPKQVSDNSVILSNSNLFEESSAQDGHIRVYGLR